jgi:Fe-S-cluster containining protein
MEYVMKVGRNDPCPCGSGKKYKKCCGKTTHEPPTPSQEPNPFIFNKAIAYKGVIGRQRQDFCIKYIAKKNKDFNLIQRTQIEETTKRGETISCREGCCSCCSLYVEAPIQECEAIVYWLYQNDEVLTTFLQKYPLWRDRIRENGDLFKQCGEFWNTERTADNAQILMPKYDEIQQRYFKQNIPCPFLHNSKCSIYDVRPYLCAAHIAISPREWCDPDSPNKPKVRTAVPLEIMYDCSFYYKNLSQHIIAFMPIAIYEILKVGTLYFSEGRVPGLEHLDREFLADPEVLSVGRSIVR